MSISLLVIGFVVVLGPLVFFHELGHFLMAKKAGIRVLEFGFGFPPRLFKFWQGKGHLSIGDTRVIIPPNFKGLPLSAAEYFMLAEEEEPQAENEAGAQKQAKGLFAFLRRDQKPGPKKEPETPDVLDVGAYVDVVAEEASPGTYTLRKLSVLDETQDEVSPRHETTAQGVRLRGELTGYVPGTIYSVNWLLPLGGFVRMLGEEDPSAPDSFAAAPKRWRTGVLLAGPVMNLLLAIIVLTSVWMIGAQEAVTCRFEIDQVEANTPAAAAGLQSQDFILSIDDEPMDGCYELGKYVRAHAGQRIVVEIEREGKTLLVPLTLRAEGEYDPTIEGPMGIVLTPHPLTWTIHRSSLPEALLNTAIVMISMIAGILALPVMLLSGIGLSNFLGPIGISQAGGEAIQLSRQIGTLAPILFWIGQVSVAVGLTNLLPLPALDGGRLLFIIVEWIRGRRVDPRREMVIHLVGLGLLLLIAILISYGDVVRFVSGEQLLSR